MQHKEDNDPFITVAQMLRPIPNSALLWYQEEKKTRTARDVLRHRETSNMTNGHMPDKHSSPAKEACFRP